LALFFTAFDSPTGHLAKQRQAAMRSGAGSHPVPSISTSTALTVVRSQNAIGQQNQQLASKSPNSLQALRDAREVPATCSNNVTHERLNYWFYCATRF
jgi:hypothetical protein